MIINKPLFQKIKQNDLNYIEINAMKNKKNNKNKNKKMNNTNMQLEEIEKEEIIENYAYEFFEEKKNNIIKFNKELQYINADTEPQPEPDQPPEINNNNKKNKKVEVNNKKNKKKKNEDVIDFDEESFFLTNDKSEEQNINLNIKKDKKNVLINNNLKSVNQINLNFEKNELNNQKRIKIKENENINKLINKDNNKDTSIINYSLDQEEIANILNLDNKSTDKENKKLLNIDNNQNIIIGNDEFSKIILTKTKLLQDLYEKEIKYKNAYKEYCKQLSETMNNDYFKDIDTLDNPNLNLNNELNLNNKKYLNEKNKINNDYLIHHQTNTINDINIFCLNNNNNNNNYLNFNEPKSQTFELKNNQNLNISNNNINNTIKQSNSEPFFQNMTSAYEQYKKSKLNKNVLNKDKKQINKSNDYIRHPTIILSIRKFLNEYNISLQNRLRREFSKNPDLNYETYIDILNDLNYIDKKKLAKIYFINISIYRNIWNFLVNIKYSNIQFKNNEEYNLESNILLIFLLLLNGFFNSIQIIDELEIELSWLKFENYEKLILKNDYIEENYKELIDIRKNNLLMKANWNNLFIINNNQKNYDSENNSKGPDDVLSEYFNSYTNNNTIDLNSKNKKPKGKMVYNYSDNKLLEKKNYKQKINTDSVNNKLYAFKPRNNSIVKNNNSNKDLSKSMQKIKSLSSTKMRKIIDINQLQLEKIDSIITNNETRKEKNHKRNNLKKNFLKTSNINYSEYYNLSKNKEDANDIPINAFINNQLCKKSSNKNILSNNAIKGKSGNYSNKVKQNRTDLKKLFKNNEFKDGTINERLEKIKKQRNNSKPKGVKILINYEEYTNLDKFKDKNENENQKHKYQFKKHTPQKKSNICYNFKIEEKEYTLEHNPDENIEIEIMQLMQKNNITGIGVKSILEKIKFNQKSNSLEIK